MNEKKYINLGYCFVTFASVDNAKYAYYNLNLKNITQFQN